MAPIIINTRLLTRCRRCLALLHCLARRHHGRTETLHVARKQQRSVVTHGRRRMHSRHVDGVVCTAATWRVECTLQAGVLHPMIL